MQISPIATRLFAEGLSRPPNLKPKAGLSHEKEFRPPLDYPCTAKIGEEGLSIMKVFHLDKHRTQFCKRVSVGTCSCGRAQDFAQILCAAIGLVIGTCVENLDDVDQVRQILDRLLTKMPAGLIVWVLEIDKTSLCLDLESRLHRRKTGCDLPLKEQADNLPFRRGDLLANDDPLSATHLKTGCSTDGVVIG